MQDIFAVDLQLFRKFLFLNPLGEPELRQISSGAKASEEPDELGLIEGGLQDRFRVKRFKIRTTSLD